MQHPDRARYRRMTKEALIDELLRLQDSVATTAGDCNCRSGLPGVQQLELLRLIVNTAPVAAWALDKSGRYLLLEGALLLERIGLRASELLGTSAFELFRDDPFWTEQIRRMLAGESFVAQHTYRGRHYEVHFLPRFDGDGHVCCGIGVTVEVTRRWQAEHNLQNQESFFETFFQSLPCAAVLSDPERRITRVNRGAEKLLGYESHELVGQWLQIVFADQDDYLQVGEKLQAGGETVQHRQEFRRKDGSLFLADSLGTNYYDSGGRVRGCISLHRDITMEEQARSVLAWHEEVHRTLIDQLPFMALLVDTRGTVLHANSAVCRHFQLETSQLIGQGVYLFIDDDPVWQERKITIFAAIADCKPVTFVDRRAGHWYEHFVVPVPDRDGVCAMVAYYAQNIDQRVLQEEQERDALTGELFSVVEELVGGETAADQGRHDRLYGKKLSAREQEVLVALASGMRTKEIAYQFQVSTKTVESQRLAVMRKLGVFNVVELTKYALKNGLVRLD